MLSKLFAGFTSISRNYVIGFAALHMTWIQVAGRGWSRSVNNSRVVTDSLRFWENFGEGIQGALIVFLVYLVGSLLWDLFLQKVVRLILEIVIKIKWDDYVESQIRRIRNYEEYSLYFYNPNMQNSNGLVNNERSRVPSSGVSKEYYSELLTRKKEKDLFELRIIFAILCLAYAAIFWIRYGTSEINLIAVSLLLSVVAMLWAYVDSDGVKKHMREMQLRDLRSMLYNAQEVGRRSSSKDDQMQSENEVKKIQEEIKKFERKYKLS